MCIIAISPKNTAIPTAERRKLMFRHNPDGAGFMYAVNGSVHIEKGFMRLEDMERRLTELGKKFDLTALPMVFHYRIGTHGGNTPGNTHPFPVTQNRHALKALSLSVPFACAHNGIIHCVVPKKGYSDTQEYIVRRLSHIKRPYDEDILAAIGAETSSRLAFMYANGHIQTAGNFLTDKDGCFYSNASYLPRTTDLYIDNQPKWASIFRSHSSFQSYEPLGKVIDLDDDIVIDSEGELHDGAEYCMDVYGRIYERNADGVTARLCDGAHLLVGGAHRRSVDPDWDYDEPDWDYSIDKIDTDPWD